MNIVLNVNYTGKPVLHLSKESNSYTYPRHGEKFHSGKQNLFIIEKSNSSPRLIKNRRFVISIRRDGKGLNEGEHILSQIDFDEDDLLMLKNGIDEILNYKSN